MAKKRGVPGWHSMRKEQLVRALLRISQAKSSNSVGRSAASKKQPTLRAGGATKSKRSQAAAKPKKSVAKGAPKRDPRVLKRIEKVKAELERRRDLAAECRNAEGKTCSKDRLILMVRDAYWLHAYWELTRASLERARAALGQFWHTAKPVLRLLEVSDGGTAGGSSRRVLRDIEIHGGANCWYIDVVDPPKTYQAEIGYLSASSDCGFYALDRSNVVTTPKTNVRGPADPNWLSVAGDFDKIFSMSGGYSDRSDNSELREVFEERLKRPMGSPMTTRFGGGAQSLIPRDDEFEFRVDAELVIFGAVSPDAHVTLKGEPIRLPEDGSFSVRMTMPEGREVIPIVASSCDGMEQRTFVLSIDRNTKSMEPVIRDIGG
jgi:hypothetical protein